MGNKSDQHRWLPGVPGHKVAIDFERKYFLYWLHAPFHYTTFVPSVDLPTALGSGWIHGFDYSVLLMRWTRCLFDVFYPHHTL